MPSLFLVLLSNLKIFKLHLDQMEDLKLDLARFSNALADALTILHCKLLCDRVGSGLCRSSSSGPVPNGKVSYPIKGIFDYLTDPDCITWYDQKLPLLLTVEGDERGYRSTFLQVGLRATPPDPT